MADQSTFHDDFYTEMFTTSDVWGSAYPNQDEIIRLREILGRVSRIARQHYQATDTPLRILDVGCGRGWLSYLLAPYGTVAGVEPVANVVDHARTVYPDIDFHVGTPRTLIDASYTGAFDLIVCSEVIEHVPRDEQGQFLDDLATLLDTNGQAILTTPRGDVQQAWMRLFDQSSQPIEDWLTEAQFDRLIANSVFSRYERVRFYAITDQTLRGWFDRVLRKLSQALGYQNLEAKRMTVYQLLWLKK